MWRKAEKKVDVREGKEVLEGFTALAQWYKQKKAAGLGGGGGIEDTPLEGLQELFWGVFRVDPTKVVAKVCEGIAKRT